MDYILKVSPKGQVTLPKKLREWLKVEDFVEIGVKDNEGILRKPDVSTEKLAGCFKKYVVKNKISMEQALDKARNMVAYEITQKNN